MSDREGRVGARFPECPSCRWFRSARCLPCGAGEFYEEKISELCDDDENNDRDYEEELEDDEA